MKISNFIAHGLKLNNLLGSLSDPGLNLSLRSRVTRSMESEFSKDLKGPQSSRPPLGRCVCIYPPTQMLLAWKRKDLLV